MRETERMRAGLTWRNERDGREESGTDLAADGSGAVVAARTEEDVYGAGDEGVDGLLDARVDGAAGVAVIHPQPHTGQQRFRSAEHLAHRHVNCLPNARHGEEPASVIGQQRADHHRVGRPRFCRRHKLTAFLERVVRLSLLVTSRRLVEVG